MTKLYVEQPLASPGSAKELGTTGFSSGWQGCSSGFPSGFALGKSLGAALPALGKPRPSLLFYLDYPIKHFILESI